MAGLLPQGEPVPDDGALPPSAALGAFDRSFSAYVHVPFCRVRCGYCDFNTYTSDELRGASQLDYRDELAREIDLSVRVLDEAAVQARPLSSVFFGGGTPTLLPADHLVHVLALLGEAYGFADGIEVTVEANPDTVDVQYFETLAQGGVTRVSIGMQSAVPSVLATLDRTHDPDAVPVAVASARQAGLQTSVDLIYGAPGESLADWTRTVEAATALETDHISAYALIVEDGTALARKISRGELPQPDDDLEADMYELADERLTAAGFEWYEVSNWARTPAMQSVHNLAYWSGQDWWGYGPGAHSHIGGVRWWNVKHPSAYADRLRSQISPGHGREILTPEQSNTEKILLNSRIRRGLEASLFAPAVVAGLIADGLVNGQDALRGRLVMTVRGRLLADEVVRRLTSEN
jgi:putative oxygen-independent coproporphyrinogen III oxidase